MWDLHALLMYPLPSSVPLCGMWKDHAIRSNQLVKGAACLRKPDKICCIENFKAFSKPRSSSFVFDSCLIDSRLRGNDNKSQTQNTSLMCYLNKSLDTILCYNQTMNKTYHLILQPEPEGGYTVIVPSLPGCVTYGKDLKEAKTMAADAITAYLASLKKHQQPLPNDDQSLFATINLNLPRHLSYA